MNILSLMWWESFFFKTGSLYLLTPLNPFSPTTKPLEICSLYLHVLICLLGGTFKNIPHISGIIRLLTYFTYHSILRVLLYFPKWQDFLLFYGWKVFCGMACTCVCVYTHTHTHTHIFCIHSSINEHLGWLHVLAIVMKIKCNEK